MPSPYLLLSDVHAHHWSAFGGRDSDGVSLRLKIILNEIERAAAELEKAGGRNIVIAGDLFHVRGSVAPEVFNPTHLLFQSLLLEGFRITAIPGNHDLASRETTELGNAFQTLSALDGFTVVSEPRPFHLEKGVTPFFIPWFSTNEGLRATVAKMQEDYGADIADHDLIIHAGINGILTGLPDHGLEASEVASWGFKRVFAGHYHDHKVLEDGKVISIGATTMQTWSDVGTKAGFLLVYPDEIKWFASHAPSFVEITDETPEDEVPLIVDGNYVRVRGKKATDAEITDMRRAFEKLGAKGFSYQGVREVVSARAPSAAHKALTLAESVAAYVKDKGLGDDVAREALDVLATVTASAA